MRKWRCQDRQRERPGARPQRLDTTVTLPPLEFFLGSRFFGGHEQAGRESDAITAGVFDCANAACVRPSCNRAVWYVDKCQCSGSIAI